MIWVKTDAGRVEMQARALVKDRARRNLLLLIDGSKSEEMLLANLAGITADRFPGTAEARPDRPGRRRGDRRQSVARRQRRLGPHHGAPAACPAVRSTTPQFTAALTKLISANLGLRGFTLTLAVEKAGTIEELREVAHRTLDQIRERKGEAVAAEARKTLYGG